MTRHLRVLTFGLIALSAVAPLAQTAATGRLKAVEKPVRDLAMAPAESVGVSSERLRLSTRR
jgi:hypothetical protein